MPLPGMLADGRRQTHIKDKGDEQMAACVASLPERACSGALVPGYSVDTHPHHLLSAFRKRGPKCQGLLSHVREESHSVPLVSP